MSYIFYVKAFGIEKSHPISFIFVLFAHRLALKVKESIVSISATYRLQLNGNFDFQNVAHSLPYLKKLGIDTLYLSPIFKATPGSTHGYDQTDPTKFNPELEQKMTFEQLSKEAKKKGFHILLDIVPNHMATHIQNEWWESVLEQGHQSPYAGFFDIDWEQVKTNQNKILLPVLGNDLKLVIENGELRKTQFNGKEYLNYYEQVFPSSDEHYELAWWKKSLSQLHYRRFFDITGLIGVKVESWDVFKKTHQLVLELVKQGQVHGLRIDHVDGLRNPTEYLRRLSSEVGWQQKNKQIVILVEKILEGHERLPDLWPVDGTTGYEFMNALNDLFIDEKGELQLREEFSSAAANELLYKTKLEIIDLIFIPEFIWLERLLLPFGLDDMELAITVLKKLTAALDVYRTYLNENANRNEDRLTLERAYNALMTYEKLSVSEQKYLDWWMDFLSQEQLDSNQDAFIARWQQVSGAVMAKGYEDTFLYRYYPLSSRNEVGSMVVYPAHNAIEDFHIVMHSIESNSSLSLHATSTHDNKRSEDTRARINVLSEIPEQWLLWLGEFKKEMGPFEISDNILSLLGQSVFGTWDANHSDFNNYQERIFNYLVKASREGKVVNSWLSPNTNFENNLKKALDFFWNSDCKGFKELKQMISENIFYGRMNSLNQILLKIMSPSPIDFYQGNELWDDSLVDPDNRRFVDFECRKDLLEQMEGELGMMDKNEILMHYLKQWNNGQIKMYLTWIALKLRQQWKTFETTNYFPLEFEGKLKDCLIGFKLENDTKEMSVICSRFLKRINYNPENYSSDIWSETWVKLSSTLQGYEYLSGRALHGCSLKEILKTAPFAILLTER